MATYGSYEAVRDLDEATLRHLLADGDRVERVWAAWSLAAILGRRAAPGMLADGDIGRSAGARRHLLVILAGLGERVVIRVMAEGDPSPMVRASGCQYLLQTWEPGDAETGRFLRFCLFSDPSSEVRDEILKGAAFDRLELGLAELVELANDRSAEVRSRVMARLRERHPVAEIAASGLYKRLAVEDHRQLLRELGRLAIETDGPGRVLAAAEAQGTEGCLTLLDLLVESQASFDWLALNSLASRREPEIDGRVLHLMGDGGGPVAFAWLVHAVASRLAQPGVPDWDFIEDAWKPLGDALGDMPAAVVLPLRPNLETIIRYAESIPEPEAGDSEAGDRRIYFVDLRRKLTALIDSASPQS